MRPEGTFVVCLIGSESLRRLAARWFANFAAICLDRGSEVILTDETGNAALGEALGRSGNETQRLTEGLWYRGETGTSITAPIELRVRWGVSSDPTPTDNLVLIVEGSREGLSVLEVAEDTRLDALPFGLHYVVLASHTLDTSTLHSLSTDIAHTVARLRRAPPDANRTTRNDPASLGVIRHLSPPVTALVEVQPRAHVDASVRATSGAMRALYLAVVERLFEGEPAPNDPGIPRPRRTSRTPKKSRFFCPGADGREPTMDGGFLLDPVDLGGWSFRAVEQFPWSVQDALPSGRCIIVLGEAGLGKSWFLSDLAKARRAHRLSRTNQWDPTAVEPSGALLCIDAVDEIPRGEVEDDLRRWLMQSNFDTWVVAARSKAETKGVEAAALAMGLEVEYRHLQPLTRREAREILRAGRPDLDPADVLDFAARTDHERLAARPITLLALADWVADGRSEHASTTEVLDVAITELLKSRGDKGAASVRVAEWVAPAARLAFAFAACAPTSERDADAMAAAVLAEVPTEAKTGLLQSRLFDGAFFSHNLWRDALAARHLVELETPTLERQVALLWVDLGDGVRRIRPRLRDVARFCAARDARFAERILEADPSCLVDSAGALSPSHRVDLLRSVVEAWRKADLPLPRVGWNARAAFAIDELLPILLEWIQPNETPALRTFAAGLLVETRSAAGLVALWRTLCEPSVRLPDAAWETLASGVREAPPAALAHALGAELRRAARLDQSRNVMRLLAETLLSPEEVAELARPISRGNGDSYRNFLDDDPTAFVLALRPPTIAAILREATLRGGYWTRDAFMAAVVRRATELIGAPELDEALQAFVVADPHDVGEHTDFLPRPLRRALIALVARGPALRHPPSEESTIRGLVVANDARWLAARALDSARTAWHSNWLVLVVDCHLRGGDVSEALEQLRQLVPNEPWWPAADFYLAQRPWTPAPVVAPNAPAQTRDWPIDGRVRHIEEKLAEPNLAYSRWWDLDRAFTENRRWAEFNDFSVAVWEAVPEHLRPRVLEAAGEFLQAAHPRIERRGDTTTSSGGCVVGLCALSLLCHVSKSPTLESVSPRVLERWIEPSLVWSPGPGVHQTLATMLPGAFARVLAEVCSAQPDSHVEFPLRVLHTFDAERAGGLLRAVWQVSSREARVRRAVLVSTSVREAWRPVAHELLPAAKRRGNDVTLRGAAWACHVSLGLPLVAFVRALVGDADLTRTTLSEMARFGANSPIFSAEPALSTPEQDKRLIEWLVELGFSQGDYDTTGSWVIRAATRRLVRGRQLRILAALAAGTPAFAWHLEAARVGRAEDEPPFTLAEVQALTPPINDSLSLRQRILWALEEIEDHLNGAEGVTGAVWNTGNGTSPKAEPELSNWLRGELARRLPPEVVSHRESEFSEGAARLDLCLEARNARVVVEVKGVWHPKLADHLRSQLVKRYLGPDPSAAGLYLVFWFSPDAWTGRDGRRATAVRAASSAGDLEAQLQEEASRSGARVLVRVFEVRRAPRVQGKSKGGN